MQINPALLTAAAHAARYAAATGDGSSANGANGASGAGGATGTTGAGNGDLTQNSFIQLLSAQLQAQTPDNTMDPNQMMSELVGFNTLQQIMDINQLLGQYLPGMAAANAGGSGGTGNGGATSAGGAGATGATAPGAIRQ